MNPKINLHHKLRVSEFGYDGNKKTGSQKITELVNKFLGVGKAWINSKVFFLLLKYKAVDSGSNTRRREGQHIHTNFGVVLFRQSFLYRYFFSSKLN